MIKRKSPLGLRLVLISSLSVSGLTPLLEKDWFEWETRFGVFPKPATVEIRAAEPSNDRLAHAAGGKIYLSPKALVSSSVPKHELAHAFLAHYCPRLSEERLLQETFAYYVSGDYRRMIEGSNFAYARSAQRYFNDHRNKINERQDLGEPLSRLLLEQVDRLKGGAELEKRWKTIFKECAEADVKQTREDMIAWLTGAPPGELKGEEGFVLLDRASGLPLLESGAVDAPQPAASLLKPVLLSAGPEMLKPRFSRQSETWICEKGEKVVRRSWTWSEALTHSCNGFFLDSDPSESTLQKFAGLLPRWPGRISAAQAVGLLPGIELSPREMARLYARVARSNPEIIAALKYTPREGTLTGLPDSDWFFRQGIALKSGTIRDLSERPRLGWIAAVSKSWVAVYYKRATAPAEMLGGLRSYVQPFAGLKGGTAEVQILGLVPENEIELRCDDGRVVWAHNLKSGDTLDCELGPVHASFPLKAGGRGETDYYGKIVKTAFTEETPKAAREKQAKARRGSQLVLRTSELNYVLGVLAAEFPRARLETLKSLSLVARANLRGGRHGERAVCDTTHCQVFQNGYADFPKAERERMLRAAVAVEQESIPAGWYPYSLGGLNSWSERRPVVEVEKVLSESAVKKWLKGHRPRDCERARNHLKLPSCPNTLEREADEVVFSGTGSGHGLGMDLSAADSMAAQGRGFREILAKFYPALR